MNTVRVHTRTKVIIGPFYKPMFSLKFNNKHKAFHTRLIIGLLRTSSTLSLTDMKYKLRVEFTEGEVINLHLFHQQ